MNKTALYGILSRYKYLITFVLGMFIVCFADSNSLYHRVLLQYEILDLQSEIEQYTKIYEKDKSQLRDLERNPRNIERIARERYFMKTDDEDIFVLSTDPRFVNEFPTSKIDESDE
ncbi:MAG: septum formation initiator family protein [Bacteroidales bacterium]|nr:septum formation initiator family protein [Bacteroidales bacterium]MCM1147961.1 septum formation initiator family protein [Bacteroidales bacterium]MCM1206885.1 septum formation initiator family protein [Bacillota bacterium]MCM1509518.1 septum formation initiator family protein [Clostridium sp.]